MVVLCDFYLLKCPVVRRLLTLSRSTEPDTYQATDRNCLRLDSTIIIIYTDIANDMARVCVFDNYEKVRLIRGSIANKEIPPEVIPVLGIRPNVETDAYCVSLSLN